MTGETSGTRGERTALPPSSSGLTIAAAVLPFVVASTWVALLVFSVPHFSRLVASGGGPAWFVLGAFVLGALALMVLCAVAARGVRMPAVAPLGAVALPWAIGLAGMRLGVHRTIRAVASADAEYHRVMAAAGVGEASTCRALGAWCTMALGLGAALGLACAAAAPHAANRRSALAGLGLVVGAPFVFIALAMPLAAHPTGALAYDAPITAILVALAIAGAFGAAGGDAPHGQSAASAAAAVAAAVLAALAGVVAVSGLDAWEPLRVFPQADAESRVLFAAFAGRSLAAASRATPWVLAAGVVSLAVAAAWAASRARPTVGRVAGGVVVLAVMALVVGADRWVMGATTRDVAVVASAPWAPIAGFAPVVLGAVGSDTDVEVGVVVGRAAVSSRGEPAVRLDHATVVAAFRRALSARAVAGSPPEPEPAVPSVFDEHLSNPPRSPLEETAYPTVGVALDRRLTATVLRDVVRAAGEAGVRSLVLVGRYGPPEHLAEQDAELVDVAPLVRPLAVATGGVRVALEPALPPGFADADLVLDHVTVSAAAVQHVVPRAGASSAPFDVSLDWNHQDEARDSDHGQRIVYVAIGDDATADAIVALVHGAAAQYAGPQVVLLAGAIPGHPERPPPPQPEDPLVAALTGMGSLDATGTPGAPPPLQQLTGAPRAAIQRTLREHVGAVQRCYETALRRDPTLAGRVVVQFLITPAGGVISADVQATTLPPRVGDCIVTQLRTWRFPPTDGPGEVSVSYPFVFSAAP